MAWLGFKGCKVGTMSEKFLLAPSQWSTGETRQGRAVIGVGRTEQGRGKIGSEEGWQQREVSLRPRSELKVTGRLGSKLVQPPSFAPHETS